MPNTRARGGDYNHRVAVITPTITQDTFGRITQITDPAGNHISYGYNTTVDLISVTDQIDHTTRFSYLPDRPH